MLKYRTLVESPGSGVHGLYSNATDYIPMQAVHVGKFVKFSVMIPTS